MELYQSRRSPGRLAVLYSGFLVGIALVGIVLVGIARESVSESVHNANGTIFVRFDVAYGAPAPREGVQPEEGGTLQGWGYIRMLP